MDNDINTLTTIDQVDEAMEDRKEEEGVERQPDTSLIAQPLSEDPSLPEASQGIGEGGSPFVSPFQAEIKTGKRVIGIRLFGSSMVYRLAANFPGLSPDDRLLLQTRDGEAEGRVVFVSHAPHSTKSETPPLFPGRITRIIRKVTAKDDELAVGRRSKELAAKILGRERVRASGLPMKLGRVSYQPGGNKAIFYFTSEERVDFRELVKELSQELQVRIEMRHMGVRDETKIIGGMGHCGKDYCCSQYLKKFHPVSVRMAKNQELSLNPDGISGVCGRLMCCLAYENDAYTQLRCDLPKLKKCCWTKDGREGMVRSVQPLRGSVTLQFADGSREQCFAEGLSDQKPSEDLPEILPLVQEEDEVISEVEGIGEVEAVEEGGVQGEGSGAKKRNRKRRGKRAKPVEDLSVVPPSGGGVEEVPSTDETGDVKGVGDKRRRRKRRRRVPTE